MKATLYAVHLQSGWTWRATLHFETDLGFWLQQEGPAVEIIELHPLISWGQAVWLQRLMNSRLSRYSMQDLNEIRREIIKALNVLQANEDMLDKLELIEVDWLLWQQKRQAERITAPLALGDRLPVHWSTAVQGRSLLPNEWMDLHTVWTTSPDTVKESVLAENLQEAYLLGQIQLTQGIALEKRRKLLRDQTLYSCGRCGSGAKQMRWTHCLFCESPCPYCEQCLTMGRVRFCTPLIQGGSEDSLHEASSHNRQSAASPDVRSLTHWGLNAAQTDASQAGMQFLQRTPPISSSFSLASFLVWAVTGAGKTEMIFPMIEYELAHGRKVMIATPRRDVVMELLPRLQAAFPQYTLLALYGGSKQRWEQGDITLATTHQLLRFHHSFDLVILDELDAFPFHNNPMLEFAARKACKPQGRFIFLSATPPARLQKAVKRNVLPHVKVPVRFHRHPLPVPQLMVMKPLVQWIDKQPMPQSLAKPGAATAMTPIPVKLLQALQQSLERGAQLFIFVAQIRWIEPLVLLLRAHFQDKVIHGTYSQDADRNEKVVNFRQAQTDILVTTTILERGITVAKTDVFVLGADAAIFDDASLVQMAGRAGRSKDDPRGRVYYAAYHRTNAQMIAIRQIKKMNAIAKAKGYLKSIEVAVDKE